MAEAKLECGLGDKMSKKKDWRLTPWKATYEKGILEWIEQPVILVRRQVPFYADTPEEYIAKLQETHDDETFTRGSFYTYIGEFKDIIEARDRSK